MTMAVTMNPTVYTTVAGDLATTLRRFTITVVNTTDSKEGVMRLPIPTDRLPLRVRCRLCRRLVAPAATGESIDKFACFAGMEKNIR